MRADLREPSTARSQEVLAHWADQLGAWLNEREGKERVATAAREKEEKEKEERELEAAAACEREETEREEREATACEKEGKGTVDTKTEAEGEDKGGGGAEARRVSPTRASEPQTSTAENPRSRDHLAPVILRRPHASTPIEVASLELVREPPIPPRDTAQEDAVGLSTEEQQSRSAELELEQYDETRPSTARAEASPEGASSRGNPYVGRDKTAAGHEIKSEGI